MDKRTLRIFIRQLIAAHENLVKYRTLATERELYEMTAIVQDGQRKLNGIIDALPIPENEDEEGL